jgi:hypothetical protein
VWASYVLGALICIGALTTFMVEALSLKLAGTFPLVTNTEAPSPMWPCTQKEHNNAHSIIDMGPHAGATCCPRAQPSNTQSSSAGLLARRLLAVSPSPQSFLLA